MSKNTTRIGTTPSRSTNGNSSQGRASNDTKASRTNKLSSSFSYQDINDKYPDVLPAPGAGSFHYNRTYTVKQYEIQIHRPHVSDNVGSSKPHIFIKDKEKGFEYSQNNDGSPHDKHKSNGSPPNSVKKYLKKNGWDWDQKEKDYEEKQNRIEMYRALTKEFWERELAYRRQGKELARFILPWVMGLPNFIPVY